MNQIFKIIIFLALGISFFVCGLFFDIAGVITGGEESEGLIMIIVTAVTLFVWSAIALYLFMIDRRITAMEEEIGDILKK